MTEDAVKSCLGVPGYYPDIASAIESMRGGARLHTAGATYWMEEPPAPKGKSVRRAGTRGSAPALSDDEQATQ